MLRALAALAAAASLIGCGISDDRAQARAVVERFLDAVRAGDGEAACAQLGESTVRALETQSGQACERVITRLEHEGGAVTRTRVYITSAIVELRGGERAFLDRGPEGWRISAVGCRPQDGPPQAYPMACEAEA